MILIYLYQNRKLLSSNFALQRFGCAIEPEQTFLESSSLMLLVQLHGSGDFEFPCPQELDGGRPRYGRFVLRFARPVDDVDEFVHGL